MASPLTPYDAVLLQSFGGPNGPDEVMPFLRNVVRGRNVPDERLAVVAEHYLAHGGVSPINTHNLALRQALADELVRRGIDAPVLWGNRNWEPYLADTLSEAALAGAHRIVSVVTSAYSSYSGCRQYWDDIDKATAQLRTQGLDDLVVDRIRPYFNSPGFVTANARAVGAAWGELSAALAGASGRVVFVTHSIPTQMDRTSGPDGGAYTAQHRAVAAEVMRELGDPVAWDLVFCSRSGPPSQPWLEPDVNDHLRELAAQGVAGVVLAPIGFISDHMEVVHDLDTEAAQSAAELGMAMVRSATVDTDPVFVSGLVDLILERAAIARGERPEPATVTDLPALAVPCLGGCCPRPARPGAPA